MYVLVCLAMCFCSLWKVATIYHAVHEEVVLARDTPDRALMSNDLYLGWLQYARRPRSEEKSGEEAKPTQDHSLDVESDEDIERVRRIRKRVEELTSIPSTPLCYFTALIAREEEITNMPFGEFTAPGEFQRSRLGNPSIHPCIDVE